jgi:hypothetical protein
VTAGIFLVESAATPQEADSALFSILNTSGAPAGPHEADSALFSVLNTSGIAAGTQEADSALFSVLNTAGVAAGTHEADSTVFSVLNTAGVAAGNHEADSTVFSVLNTAGVAAGTQEADSELFSVENSAQVAAASAAPRQRFMTRGLLKPAETQLATAAATPAASRSSEPSDIASQTSRAGSVEADLNLGDDSDGGMIAGAPNSSYASLPPEPRASAIFFGLLQDFMRLEIANQAGESRQ